MFRIVSEEALLAAFRPKDRRRLEPPAGIKYPHFVRDYFAWTEGSGFAVNLVFCVTGGVPTGISFHRNGASAKGALSMCEWCHSQGSADQIGLLTADVNAKKRVGVLLCLDLGCRERLEDAALRSGRSPLEPTRQLLERISRFAIEALGMDLTAAGR